MNQKQVNRAIIASNTLREIQDSDTLLERILFEARRCTNADAGSIYITQGDKLFPYYSQNATLSSLLYNHIDMEQLLVPINQESISGYCALTKEPLIIPDVYGISPKEPYSFSKATDQRLQYRSKSMIAIPLKDGQRVIGVIQLINKLSSRGKSILFKEDDAFLLSLFSLNATIALEQAQITRNLIFKLIAITEMHDPSETAPHVNRVAEYSKVIYTQWAQIHGISNKKLELTRDTIRLAAMLHDIGKISVSDKILHSYKSITSEQRKIMNTHTWKGARLFQNAETELERMVHDVALTHHEKWDGTGYPGYVDIQTGESLYPQYSVPVPRKDLDIPLPGRIVALADVYDALRSARSYKDALPEETCLREIKSQKGKHFDPEIVDVFFQTQSEINKICKAYPT